MELPCPSAKWLDLVKSKGLGLLILWHGQDRNEKQREQQLVCKHLEVKGVLTDKKKLKLNTTNKKYS